MGDLELRLKEPFFQTEKCSPLLTFGITQDSLLQSSSLEEVSEELSNMALLAA